MFLFGRPPAAPFRFQPQWSARADLHHFASADCREFAAVAVTLTSIMNITPIPPTKA
jgi:hypothetical protein